MKIVSIKPMNCYPKKDIKKHNIVLMKKKDFYKKIYKIEKDNMKRYGSTIQHSAIIEWMGERCIIEPDEPKLFYVLKDKFDIMLKRYKDGKIHSPFDLKVPVINPIIKGMLEGVFGEC